MKIYWKMLSAKFRHFVQISITKYCQVTPVTSRIREFHGRVVHITSCKNCSAEERLTLERTFLVPTLIPATWEKTNWDILYRFDVNFFNCYILRLSLGRLPVFVIAGVSLVPHLGNFFMDQDLYFNKSNDYSRMSGMKLSLHQPDTYPVVGFDGYFLPPGYFNDFKLKFVMRKRLYE